MSQITLTSEGGFRVSELEATDRSVINAIRKLRNYDTDPLLNETEYELDDCAESVLEIWASGFRLSGPAMAKALDILAKEVLDLQLRQSVS